MGRLFGSASKPFSLFRFRNTHKRNEKKRESCGGFGFSALLFLFMQASFF